MGPETKFLFAFALFYLLVCIVVYIRHRGEKEPEVR
jgi:hypothetical protein